MHIRHLLIIQALCLTLTIAAQAQPHLEGTIRIRMSDGLIDCRFRLSNINAKQYNILLYRGMNIKHIRSDSGQVLHYEGYHDGKTSGEAMEYTLMRNRTLPFPVQPQSFTIEYKGAFPIYTDTLNSFDYKGFIAFNGKTLRASEQTKWYPVLYDIGAERLIDKYTFDITVYSDDARTVFLNGAPPQQQQVARFTTTTPKPLLLFAGDYNFLRVGKDYLLNTSVDSSTAQAIFRNIQQLKTFYEQKLGIPYQEGIYILSHKAVEPYNPGRSWGFATYPSFAYAGLDFTKLITPAGTFDHGTTGFFAHELAHYYFNSHTGPLMWFWVESAAEYLSLKAVEARTDTGFYHRRLRSYVKNIRDKKYTPLGRIAKTEEIDNNYRYQYGPLILWCFEQQFGQQVTYRVLADVVQQATRGPITTAAWKQIALANKIKEADYDRFHATYLDNDEALLNVCQQITNTIH